MQAADRWHIAAQRHPAPARFPYAVRFTCPSALRLNLIERRMAVYT